MVQMWAVCLLADSAWEFLAFNRRSRRNNNGPLAAHWRPVAADKRAMDGARPSQGRKP